MNIGPNEVTVALNLMQRAPIEGHEAKAVAVTIDKFEKWLAAMSAPQVNLEEDDGNYAEPTE
jgi:hypothetical protein